MKNSNTGSQVNTERSYSNQSRKDSIPDSTNHSDSSNHAMAKHDEQKQKRNDAALSPDRNKIS